MPAAPPLPSPRASRWVSFHDLAVLHQAHAVWLGASEAWTKRGWNRDQVFDLAQTFRLPPRNHTTLPDTHALLDLVDLGITHEQAQAVAHATGTHTQATAPEMQRFARDLHTETELGAAAAVDWCQAGFHPRSGFRLPDAAAEPLGPSRDPDRGWSGYGAAWQVVREYAQRFGQRGAVLYRAGLSVPEGRRASSGQVAVLTGLYALPGWKTGTARAV